jgi:hypothetical protein
VLDQPLVCESRNAAAGPVLDEVHANHDGPGVDPGNPAAENPIRWEAFFNYAQAFSYPLQATPAGSARDIVPRDKLGGFLSNIDNAYTFAYASRGVAPVLVLEGRAPTTPLTRAGQPVMGDGQVRYWSLCQNEFASQRVIDCVYDEQVATGAGGRFRLVVSTPGSRPANARPECGVNWIRWGGQPDGLVILRHMLPSAGFAQAIQNVSQAGSEQAVVGEYLPTGTHTTKADFESRGCAAGTGGGERARPRIALTITPATARAGRTTTFRAHATYHRGSRRLAVRGALVRFGRRTARTDARGRAAIRQRFTRSGRYRPRACKGGFACGRATVKVTR